MTVSGSLRKISPIVRVAEVNRARREVGGNGGGSRAGNSGEVPACHYPFANGVGSGEKRGRGACARCVREVRDHIGRGAGEGKRKYRGVERRGDGLIYGNRAEFRIRNRAGNCLSGIEFEGSKGFRVSNRTYARSTGLRPSRGHGFGYGVGCNSKRLGYGGIGVGDGECREGGSSREREALRVA